jgi:hypothetical protein
MLVGEPEGGSGTWLVLAIINVSPGLTWRVGDSDPDGVSKQYRVRPSLSVCVK